MRQAKTAHSDLIDLTVSNPTVCGFHYDPEAILAPLQNPQALTYDAQPRGLPEARRAIARYYARHGAAVSLEQINLTSSTSEAYSHLFRLLCEAGDEVLIAQPSYPLFDFLADLHDVRLRPYALLYDQGWSTDFAMLEREITPRSKAIVIVHPNNPTGHATSLAERRRMEDLCLERKLALIVDEVFLDYPSNDAQPIESFTRGTHAIPTFVLSGISKIAGLPQMKVAWIVSCGSRDQQREAAARIEMIADTFLSVNTPVQLALPTWLDNFASIRHQISERTRTNLSTLSQFPSVQALHADAGWSAILRLPQRSGEAADLELLRRGVVVHPGSFYGMPQLGRVVVSTIVPIREFREAITRIAEYCSSS